MLDAWIGWRKSRVSSEVRIGWNVSVMAVVWFVWFERNGRIFSQKCKSNVALLASINSYITFWLNNLPAKQWKAFARSRFKGLAGRRTTPRTQPTDAADKEKMLTRIQDEMMSLFGRRRLGVLLE